MTVFLISCFPCLTPYICHLKINEPICCPANGIAGSSTQTERHWYKYKIPTNHDTTILVFNSVFNIKERRVIKCGYKLPLLLTFPPPQKKISVLITEISIILGILAACLVLPWGSHQSSHDNPITLSKIIGSSSPVMSALIGRGIPESQTKL